MSYYPTTCDCSGEVVYGPAQCHYLCQMIWTPAAIERLRKKKYGMLCAFRLLCIR